MGKIKAYSSRSRSGCLTCKKRRVKCDEQHPICGKCAKLKIECNYKTVARWEDEAADKGITFGRSDKARKRRVTSLSDAEPDFDLSVHRDITTKRKNYLFISFAYSDFTKVYDAVHLEKPKRETHKKNVDKSSEMDGILDLTIPPLEESEMTPFNSSFITRFFSAPGQGNDSSARSPITKFDDIFLSSFSSQDLTYPLSPYLIAPTDSHLIDVEPFKLENMEMNPLHLTNSETHLLNYFVTSIGPHCVCYPNSGSGRAKSEGHPEANPYLYLVVPLALRSRLVLNAVIAASAKQLILLNQKEYEPLAKKYSLEVLKELPTMIESKRLRNDDDWDEVFATMIMLCFTEISVRCDRSWLIHLNGAKQFLKDSCIHKNLTAVGKFFVKYFISHEVMAETAWACGQPEHDALIFDDDAQIESLKNDVDLTIDLVLGCSPYLISLIHKVSRLGKCLENLEFASSKDRERLEPDILRQADSVKKELLSMRQELPSVQEVDEKSACHIETIAEIKRLAALIYLFARVQLEYKSFHKAYICRSEEVTSCITLIMKLYNCLSGDYVSLLWPIFIVGIFASNEEERWFVLNALAAMEKHRELSSVKNAKNVISSIWKERDFEFLPKRWKDIIKDKTNAISLA